MASLVAALLAAAMLAACGDEGTQTLTFTLNGDGKFTAPESADPGLTEITLENKGKGASDLQLIRVEGDHSAEEVIEGLEKATKGEAFPGWFFAGGGTGSTPAGKSLTVTQVLQPGTYYTFRTEGSEGPPDPKSATAVEVSGEQSDDAIEADATVSALDYAFNAEGLTAGKTEVAFKNTGDEPHHLLITELVGNSSAQDVESAFESEKGEPPLNEENSEATAVIEAGETQLVTLDLKPGRYAFYCFVSDRQGGPPHALKGMVDAIEVKK